MAKKATKRENGDGYIERTKSGKYACTITSKYIDPNTLNYKKIKRTMPTEKEAIAEARKALKAWETAYIENTTYKEGVTTTFGEYVEDYLKHEVEGRVTQSCLYSYTKDFELYIKKYSISRMQLRNLSKRMFQAYYDSLTVKYAPRSIEFPVQLCRRTCRWLVDRNLLDANFAEQAKPKYDVVDEFEYIKDQEHKETFTTEDMIKFYNAYVSNLTEYASIVVLLLETGLRPQEFASLTNADVDLEKKQIEVCKTTARRFVDDTKTKTELYTKTTKTKKNRIVPLSPLAVDVVMQMQAKTKALCKSNPNDILYPTFINGRVRTNATMEAGMKLLCEKLDIDRDVHPTRGGQKKGLNMYACRHTCETLMNGNGGNPLITGAMLGHDATVGLKHYTHITADMIANQAKTPFDHILPDEAKLDMSKVVETKEEVTEEDELALLKILMEKYKDKL